MATILEGVSRTFAEFLLIPRLTRKDQKPDQVDLSTPLSAIEPNKLARFKINTPGVSAAMQSVSGARLLSRDKVASALFFAHRILPARLKWSIRLKPIKRGLC